MVSKISSVKIPSKLPRPSASPQKLAPVKFKTSSTRYAAEEALNNFAGSSLSTIFNGYYNYNFLKNRSAKQILTEYGTSQPFSKKLTNTLKGFQATEKDINKSLNVFGLTTALSFIPNLVNLGLDGLLLNKIYRHNKQKNLNNKQRIEIVDKLIATHDQKITDQDAVFNLQKSYQKLDDQESQNDQSIAKLQKLSGQVKLGANSLSSIGGLISAHYLYKVLRNPTGLSNIVTTLKDYGALPNNSNAILTGTKIGMALYAAGLGASALSSLWQTGSMAYQNYRNPIGDETSKAKEHAPTMLENVKNHILPNAGQLLTGIGTATLLWQKDRWNIANIYSQGGAFMNMNGLFKVMQWGGALGGIAAGVIPIISAAQAAYQRYQENQETTEKQNKAPKTTISDQNNTS